MKLRTSIPSRFAAGARGFTMVEIALSLAIVGFALVAIIGVLPAGLNVQKENREDTIVNQDATLFLNAIRNGDLDGNDATERDASWTPFIDTPMHPEYPCAHCIIAATVGTILQADIGDGLLPPLATTSYLVTGSKRSWTTVDDFIQEVSEARICDGVHFRTSTEVGAAMGRKIGRLAAAKFFGARDRTALGR